jgi:integrase
MAPKPEGQIIEKDGRRGRTFAIRFRAYGRRHLVTLGSTADGWTRQKAETELRHVLADVERGLWIPPDQRPAGSTDTGPTFHEFASEWLEDRRAELAENTILDYTWQLTHHLLPFFKDHLLAHITVAEVDRYRAHKLREGVLSPESINKTITRLGQVLAVAEERDLTPRNPVRVNTRNRKLKTKRKRPIYLDHADQIVALLDAATDLDGRKQAKTAGRRGFIAVLVFAGLRIHEAAGLRWKDVDLARGRITVGKSKTDAGLRIVDILPVLHDELSAHRATATRTAREDFVFPTATGTRRDKDNARERVVRPVVARGDGLLAERGREPLPDGVTAHKLRHTFCSLLFALGKDPAYVMGQLGHTDAGFTLRTYAHAMRRDDGDLESLRALVNGADWAPLGTRRVAARPDDEPENDEGPAIAGPSDDGRGGFRTCDLSRVKRALSH